jgi:hypothetical protein
MEVGKLDGDDGRSFNLRSGIAEKIAANEFKWYTCDVTIGY